MNLDGGPQSAPSGCAGSVTNGFAVIGDEHRERDPLPVRRPRDELRRRSRQVRELRRSDPCPSSGRRCRSCRRRARRRAAWLPSGDQRGDEPRVDSAVEQRAHVRAIRVHDPEPRARVVLHDVEARPLEHDALAVGRDLRIGAPLELEDVACSASRSDAGFCACSGAVTENSASTANRACNALRSWLGHLHWRQLVRGKLNVDRPMFLRGPPSKSFDTSPISRPIAAVRSTCISDGRPRSPRRSRTTRRDSRGAAPRR